MAALAALVLTSPSQPSCDGHTITYWIAFLQSRDSDQTAHAFAAVEKIGTNGLPTILHLLGTRDSARRVPHSLPGRARPVDPSSVCFRCRRAAEATGVALAISGQESIRASVPTLADLSRDPDPGVRLRAVEMLSGLPSTKPRPFLPWRRHKPTRTPGFEPPPLKPSSHAKRSTERSSRRANNEHLREIPPHDLAVVLPPFEAASISIAGLQRFPIGTVHHSLRHLVPLCVPHERHRRRRPT